MSKSIKIGVVIIGLLVVIAATHTVTDSTLDDIAPEKKKAPPVKEAHGEKGSVQLPDPLGSPDALVKVRVYVTSDNTCDTTTLDNMHKIAKKYGDKVYISFGDMLDKDTLQEAQMAKIGCKSGLTINGKSKFILPARGLKGAILLDGPAGQSNYNIQDVEDIIAHLLHQKGVLEQDTAAPPSQDEGEERQGDDLQPEGQSDQ